LKEFRAEYHAMIVDLVKEEFKEHIPQAIMKRLVEFVYEGSHERSHLITTQAWSSLDSDQKNYFHRYPHTKWMGSTKEV